LDKFVKIASALGALLPDPICFPASGDPLQTRVCFCYFFILLQLFIRPQF